MLMLEQRNDLIEESLEKQMANQRKLSQMTKCHGPLKTPKGIMRLDI
jgi:hypothetical protein